MLVIYNFQSQWPHGLRRGYAAVRLLELRVPIPPGAWISVPCECCVLSGRGLWVGLINRPEESYRLWCVWVWSRILDNKEALAHLGQLRYVKKKYKITSRMAISGKVGWTRHVWKLGTEKGVLFFPQRSPITFNTHTEVWEEISKVHVWLYPPLALHIYQNH